MLKRAQKMKDIMHKTVAKIINNFLGKIMDKLKGI